MLEIIGLYKTDEKTVTDYVCKDLRTGRTGVMPKTVALSYAKQGGFANASLGVAFGNPYVKIKNEADLKVVGVKAKINEKTKKTLMADIETVMITLERTLKAYSKENINFDNQDTKYANANGLIGVRIFIDNKYEVIIAYEKGHDIAALYKSNANGDCYAPVVIRKNADELAKAIPEYFKVNSVKNAGLNQQELKSLNHDINTLIEALIQSDRLHRINVTNRKERYLINHDGDPTVEVQLNNVYRLTVSHGSTPHVWLYQKDIVGFPRPLSLGNTADDALRKIDAGYLNYLPR